MDEDGVAGKNTLINLVIFYEVFIQASCREEACLMFVSRICMNVWIYVSLTRLTAR